MGPFPRAVNFRDPLHILRRCYRKCQKKHSGFSWKNQKKSFTMGTAMPLVQLAITITRNMIPSADALGLHDQHQIFSGFADFEPRLTTLLQQGQRLEECIELISKVGILEPLTGEHIPPEKIQVNAPNYRESLIANGLLSRNRAILRVIENCFGSLEKLQNQQIFLPEAVTGFALWLKRLVDPERLVMSEYWNQDQQSKPIGVGHQDLCGLTFGEKSFDLVLCSELLEHVYSLELAFHEILRVLKPGGSLLATFPMAFGQYASIEKARWNSTTRKVELVAEADFHGDPLRPQEGALVFRIPGWEVVEQARGAGFSKAVIHGIASWKYGVLGGDLACVLVLEAQR